MSARRLLAGLALAGLGLGFVWGLYWIFGVRFSSGEQYPSYSTFSPSPRGSKALHEVALRMGDLQVERALDPIAFRAREFGQETVIFALGAETSGVALSSSAFWLQLEDKARSGARVVLTFAEPSLFVADQDQEGSGDEPSEAEEEEAGSDAQEEDDGASAGAPKAVALESWMQQHGLRFGYWGELPSDLEEERLWGELELDGRVHDIAFKAPRYFLAEGGPWQVLGEAYGRPIAMARDLGDGQLILFADSYPFSNEALAVEPSGFLFSWLLRGAERVVFHEEQLGVTFRESFMSLARKHGFDVALMLLLATAAAFIWRSSFSLLPREPMAQGARGIELSSSIAGLRNLLERSVPRKELASVSYRRWARSRAARSLSEAKRQRAREILDTYEKSSRSGSDLEAYCRAMSDLLSRKIPAKHERNGK